MCRWITLISAESYSLSDVVLAPSNSLVQLSRDASFHPDFTDANNATMNGDGFGIGTFGCRLYSSVVMFCLFVVWKGSPTNHRASLRVSAYLYPILQDGTTTTLPSIRT
jgi:hypothetical protein